jgi:hypothetical protein
MVEMREIHTTTRSDPANICIYCGAKEGLSKEHVVPLALGGNLILPSASCTKCAAITSDLEGKVLRGFMHDSRAVGGFPTRRPKERPKVIHYQVEREDNFITAELPLSMASGFLHLPKLQRASFLCGGGPVKGVSVVGLETITFGKSPEEVASTLGTKTIRTTVNMDATSFARMLAKIGYAFAVAKIGPFPLTEVPVLPLILGTADDGSTWVGSMNRPGSQDERRPQHLLGLAAGMAIVDDVPEQILVVEVTLFASSGASGYEVVVRRSLSPNSVAKQP